MDTGEKVIAELYETLLHLRYPGIAQVTPKDMENTILGSDNRQFLLSWLLDQSPFVPSKQFATSLDEAKLVKWYTNMGICIDVDALLGKIPMQHQITTLRNLLLFVKNVLIVEGFNSCEEPLVVDVLKALRRLSNETEVNQIVIALLKKHIGGIVNIIPPTCSLTSKLNYNKAVQYLNSTKEVQAAPHRVPQSSDEIFGTNGNNNSAPSQEHDQEKVVDKFLESFESVSTWPQLKNERSTPALSQFMNTHVENAYFNMNSLNEMLHSKKEISNFVIANRLTKREMPLDEIIEDIVIHLDEINNLHKEE